ncbi:MAG TPA: M1 family aminopeptidase, partial [Thermodesulfovibrionales bacterium]|nr:M1 family aminopeptidase [Thermodesulfovibrionales bacterium]
MKRHIQGLQSVVALILGMMIVSLLAFPQLAFSEGLPEIVTSLTFDMGRKTMKGISKIRFPHEDDTLIRTGGLKVLSVKLNGDSLKPVFTEGYLKVNVARESIIEIEYECSSEQNTSCIIDEKGILLTGSWYPSPEGLVYHRLSALVPKDLTAVSEAEEIERQERTEGNLFSFTFRHPLDGTSFIAARFTVRRDRFRDTELYGYFFPEDSGLADTYLEHTKKYLELYQGIIGEFPFKRFSVVENFLPTGYSMPTFTLLGQDVIRLPFIVRTSLGHEILHQWLGNLVYVDYEKGNWAEGLTTYLADHFYEEREGRGWQYRKQILIDFESYVNDENDFPLRDFRSRTDFASKAVGYGKASMVFHMLKGLIGEEPFSKSLKSFVEAERFRRASWDDIRTVFEKTTGRELGWFFRQWVDEKGYPLLAIKDLSVSPRGLQSAVSFDVAQNGYLYTLNIPLSIKARSQQTEETMTVNEKKQHFEIASGGNPEKMIIDKNYDLFRRLAEKEIPPVIAELLGEKKGFLILPFGEKEDSTYPYAIEFFSERGFTPRKYEEMRDEDLRRTSGVILGYGNPLVRRLFGDIEKPFPGFVIAVKKNPLDVSKVIAIVDGASREEVRAALPKLLHYGKYSLLAFEGGRNTEKTIAESERGWIMPIREPVLGIELAKTTTLSDITERISGKKIIYAGETHD